LSDRPAVARRSDEPAKEATMKFMGMVRATPETESESNPAEGQEELLHEMLAYNQALIEAGVMLAGDGLQPSAKGARVRFEGEARTVIDGPFAETRELVAGFWIWEVKDMDEALAWAKRCPNPMPGPSELELRPVITMDDFAEVMTDEGAAIHASNEARLAGE
jgi:hypothetical protein